VPENNLGFISGSSFFLTATRYAKSNYGKQNQNNNPCFLHDTSPKQFLANYWYWGESQPFFQTGSLPVLRNRLFLLFGMDIACTIMPLFWVSHALWADRLLIAY
jgi:hypothetical protein